MPVTPGPFANLVVLDFEATCNNGAPPVPQEIIEFPSVLVDAEDHQIVDEFPSFVRPVHHPRLSEFCRELTGIEQSEVDAADPFLDVLAAHQRWLASHHLDDFLFITCGDWDLARMFPAQCATAGIAVPRAYRRWCNLKLPFAAAFRRSKGAGMTSMLRTIGLELEGRHHRGIDDSRNIARIVVAMLDRGLGFEATAELSASQFPELPIHLVWRDQTHDVVLKKRAVSALLGLAGGLLRTKIVGFRDPSGAPLTDEALTDLTPHATLVAVSADDR
jgi:ERI1 exoribonuclease 2